MTDAEPQEIDGVRSTDGAGPDQTGRRPAGPGNGIDLMVDVPHPARMYDYFLGGKHNFPPDRETGEQVIKLFPNSRDVVRQNRMFMNRSTRYLAAEAGIRQFLDIGTGMFAEIY